MNTRACKHCGARTRSHKHSRCRECIALNRPGAPGVTVPVSPAVAIMAARQMDTHTYLLARMIGASTGYMRRWVAADAIPLDPWADRLACRLGLHPAEIWGDLVWAGTGCGVDSGAAA